MTTDPPTAADDAVLDRVETILARANLGEDVSADVLQLPVSYREDVEAVLDAQRVFLGTPRAAPPQPARGPTETVIMDGPMGLLADRYQVLAELGRGGMGVVFIARDLKENTRVVVKVLALDKAWNPRLRARFERETRALRKIHKHPNVVRVLDSGEDPTQGPFLVMEHIEGVPLSRRIKERNRLDPKDAFRIARDVARGLAVVHRQGLIHRDVKPANIMLTPRGGVAKLVDFGLAKDTFLTTITKADQVLGTCYYMAPEQWREDMKEDSRCDIFALGATLYHMLLGRQPFVGEDLGEIMELCLYGEYDPPEDEVDLPGDMALVLHQMLATDLRFRYTRMDDVAEDLDCVLRGEPARVPCFVEEAGTRHALVPGRRWTLGRDASCEITLLHPTVSREHAQVRKEATGYVLRDLSSSYGTSVGGHKIRQAQPLWGGETVDVGDVRLVFHDPHNDPRSAGRLSDVTRTLRRDPVVRLLVELGDPRVAAGLVEQTALDPDGERSLREATVALFGAGAGQAVAQARGRRPALVRSALAVISGDDEPRSVPGWLAWWDHARHELRDQIGVARPPSNARLHATAGATAELSLDAAGIVLLGRDTKCHLTVPDPKVSRLHATLLRLHRRWILRDEGSAAGTLVNGVETSYAFLSPGARLGLGDVELTFDWAAPPVLRATGQLRVMDPIAFEALLDMQHPAVATALVAFLGEAQDLSWVDREAASLFPMGSQRATHFAQRLRQVYTSRAQLAQQLLPGMLGGNETDPGAWRRLLAARAAALGPQVVPEGWLSSIPRA